MGNSCRGVFPAEFGGISGKNSDFMVRPLGPCEVQRW